MHVITYMMCGVFFTMILLFTMACGGNPSNRVVARTTPQSDYVSKDDDCVCLSSPYSLSPEQLDEMKKKAIKGDGKAAFKVYQYYAYCEYGGPGCYMYWLNIAITNGCAGAKEILDSFRRSEESRNRVLWGIQ